ncbi:exodeoxyribonuclease VII small subunit [Coriobacteriia bacterium Es71-Z0120]|uniref:exodeoxyribonuclease VII small subunit n=1 Tax=Parvivirga hydrogeniphila TaxID=2939460 RepID=UPI002260A736|nr:exodeoxyribonuclease VII small subunit [Parvivirga hydrogeniphila]MCL4079136.1 exodeoxyribonuclease VII small subunit [Parvivirga hydrogeniphila]
MSDERYTFEQARARLEEIASLVRKKDTSLERSLELLEESVRLANVCTELVDRTDVGATAAAPPDESEGGPEHGEGEPAAAEEGGA